MPAIVQYLTEKFSKKETIQAPPPITTSTAILLLALYTVLYVAPFYLSAKTRPSARLSRDAPSVIRARITSVSLTCAVTSLSTLAVLVIKGGYENYDAFHSMGYWPVGMMETLKALLLTATLFLGPLFETLVVEGYWRECLAGEPVKEVFGDWTVWRNIVAGPVTEEILFRSAAIPLMILARTSLTKTIFLSPLVFGLAHVHHLYEFRITHPTVSLPMALLRSVFQLGYTTLFGAYATFLYLRTGSLLAVVVVHMLCNTMGLPRVMGAVTGRGREDGSVVAVGRAWSVAYYVLLVVGAVGWYRGLWVLTESGNALVAM